MDTWVKADIRKIVGQVEDICRRLEELVEEEPADVQDDMKDAISIFHDVLWELDRMTA